ncbi:MAG: type II toxin-antitoxin system RelE/ParE family toxin [Betaproteobacteria bacterium]|nr:type II toxin-antitoxin system RelE/ParE family toxin [Betaproteobacteria bacterium]
MLKLVISPAAAETIRYLPPSIKRGVKQAIRAIAADPGCGEPLERELAEYRKFKVRRFRIVYAIDRGRRIVRIVAVGPRRTIYEDLAERLRGGS